MKKVFSLNLVIILIIISFAFSIDRTDSKSRVNDDQFKIESKKLKTEYSALEKQISDYYSGEFKRLKEQQSAELETLHRELKEKYYELQKQYGIDESSLKAARTDQKHLKKTKKIKPVKETRKSPGTTKQRKKPIPK